MVESKTATIGTEERVATFRAQIIRSIARQKLFAFASLILLMVFFSLASPFFMQVENLLGILQSTAVNGVLAIAATGALSGMLSGTFVAKLKLPPFIATLGMMLVNKGLALVVAGDKPIYFNDTEGFSEISQGSLIGYILPSLPVPNSVLILFALAIAASLLLSRTALGRYTFALGSNEEAVRLSGVNVDRWKITIYMLAGAICGIAGLLIASRLNSAQPALGQGYELEAIAAVVIGGTSLSGGTGTILGTIIGAFITSVLTNGLRILSVAQEWQIVVTGVIIILAVYIDILRRRRL